MICLRPWWSRTSNLYCPRPWIFKPPATPWIFWLSPLVRTNVPFTKSDSTDIANVLAPESHAPVSFAFCHCEKSKCNKCFREWLILVFPENSAQTKQAMLAQKIVSLGFSGASWQFSINWTGLILFRVSHFAQTGCCMEVLQFEMCDVTRLASATYPRIACLLPISDEEVTLTRAYVSVCRPIKRNELMPSSMPKSIGTMVRSNSGWGTQCDPLYCS